MEAAAAAQPTEHVNTSNLCLQQPMHCVVHAAAKCQFNMPTVRQCRLLPSRAARHCCCVERLFLCPIPRPACCSILAPSLASLR